MIKLKSIRALLGSNFNIPSYQRGYRWSKQQVIDLLEDIYKFQQEQQQEQNLKSFYCLQPLVVTQSKKSDEDLLDKIHQSKDLKEVETILSLAQSQWDVIDGQQRLTTIFILLSFLEEETKYTINYATRKQSKEFLTNISEETPERAQNNIDYSYIYESYCTIKAWFERKQIDKKEFTKILLDRVKFIWYETQEFDPIKVFTRLNIGKIALTDSELIKALFLNQSNFATLNHKQIRSQQIEIASEWDKIEYTLQKDEFWLFIHDLGYTKATRIDYILDIIREDDIFKLGEKLQEDINPIIGWDNHQTFRYFYEYFNLSEKYRSADWLRTTWGYVKEIFQIFEEWYNKFDLYHYVGYLIALNKGSAKELRNHYKGSKEVFQAYLRGKIKESISGCLDLETVYGENGEYKRNTFPLLLLLNIQTVINQNKRLIEEKKYGLGTFYKFPFHLFKKEARKSNGKGWEVEHIASNSGDNLEDDKNKEVWLAAVAYSLAEGDLKDKIKNYLSNNEQCDTDFQSLLDDIRKLDLNPLEGDDKQKIWNFALLDSSTNAEYQNAPFPIKRICIISKEKGYKAKVQYNEETQQIKIDKSSPTIAFVPPATKNIFTKAYTDNPQSLSAWMKEDATEYKAVIKEVLDEFNQ